VAAAVAAVVVLGLGASGVLAWRATDRRILTLELREAQDRVAVDVATARALFDVQFPGPWRLVPAGPRDSAVDIYNANMRLEAYRLTTPLGAHLYKGSIPILDNVDVERALLQIGKLTGTELTIAQRISPWPSSDPTVGNEPAGRALRLATTVTRMNAEGAQVRVMRTVMPMRDAETGARIAAGVVLASRATYDGRALEAGEDRWTRYEPIVGPDTAVIGIFYGGIPFTPFANQAHAASAEVAKWILVSGLIVAAIACLLLLHLTRRVLRPVRTIRDAALRIAAGELGARASVGGGGEIAELGGVFDGMATQIQAMNERIAIATEQLRASAKQVDTAVAGAASATQQVATSIGEVSHGAAESATRVEEATKQAHRAIEHVHAIDAEVGRALGEARSAELLATDGHAQVSRSLAVSEGVRATVGRARHVMAELDQQAGQIETIVAIIKRIASQTNLLALNAAIEAARAGDAGRGFAVVAGEVRVLADEVRKSSESIGAIVLETKTRTAGAAALMGEVEVETQAGAEAARSSDEAFRSIGTAIEHLSAQITAIKAAADAVAGAMGQVDVAIAGVAAIAQESAATSQEVSALAQEQSATFTEITREIHDVSRMAEELRSVVSGQRPDASGQRPAASGEELTVSGQRPAARNDAINTEPGRGLAA